MPVRAVVFASLRERRAAERLEHARKPQPDFCGGGGLSRVAPAEDHVLHPFAAQALGALLTHHPGDGIRDVALPAPVRSDNRRDPLVEGEFGAVRERFETVDFEAFQAHLRTPKEDRWEEGFGIWDSNANPEGRIANPAIAFIRLAGKQDGHMT